MAAPTNSEIKRLLESEYRSHLSEADLQRGEETIFQFGNLERLFTDDINISIVGSGFPLSGKFHGLSDFNSHLGTKSMPPLKSVIDVTKPIHGSVVQVIGGQADEWRAVVLHSTATGKNNKPWNHEMVVLLRFNGGGKVSELKVYSDTLHVYNHLTGSS